MIIVNLFVMVNTTIIMVCVQSVWLSNTRDKCVLEE